MPERSDQPDGPYDFFAIIDDAPSSAGTRRSVPFGGSPVRQVAGKRGCQRTN
jgi:hypothetical protein